MSRAAWWVSPHAEERAAERLGRPLTLGEWIAIANQILVDGAVLLGRDGHGPEHYAVSLGAVDVRVLWDPRIAMVITVLPWRRNDGRRLQVTDTYHRHAPPRREVRGAWRKDMDL